MERDPNPRWGILRDLLTMLWLGPAFVLGLVAAGIGGLLGAVVVESIRGP